MLLLVAECNHRFVEPITTRTIYSHQRRSALICVPEKDRRGPRIPHHTATVSITKPNNNSHCLLALPLLRARQSRYSIEQAELNPNRVFYPMHIIARHPTLAIEQT